MGYTDMPRSKHYATISDILAPCRDLDLALREAGPDMDLYIRCPASFDCFFMYITARMPGLDGFSELSTVTGVSTRYGINHLGVRISLAGIVYNLFLASKRNGETISGMEFLIRQDLPERWTLYARAEYHPRQN